MVQSFYRHDAASAEMSEAGTGTVRFRVGGTRDAYPLGRDVPKAANRRASLADSHQCECV